MSKKYTFFKAGLTVLLSVLVVSAVVYATTTVGDNVSVGGTLAVTGATTFTGAVTANGNVTLGNASGDTITVTGTPTFGADINIGTVAIDGTYFDVAATTGAVTLTQQATTTIPLTITGIASGTAAEIDLNTKNVSGSVIDVDWAAATTQTGVLAGLDIDLSNVTTDGTNAAYGIHVNDQVGNTTSTEYGIYVEGTNWDQGLYVVDAVKFDGDITITAGALTDSTILSADIKDDEIVNADVNASAAIAGTKISPDFGSQNIVTTGTLTIGGGTAISKHLSATSSVTFNLDTADTCTEATTSISGAAVGDSVAVGIADTPTGYLNSWVGWVSAANELSLKYCTGSATTTDAAYDVRWDVWQH